MASLYHRMLPRVTERKIRAAKTGATGTVHTKRRRPRSRSRQSRRSQGDSLVLACLVVGWRLKVLVDDLFVPAFHQVLVPQLVLGHGLEQIADFALVLLRHVPVQRVRRLLLL